LAISLAQHDFEAAAARLSASLVEGAPVSRPLTRLALAEALARSRRPEAAAEEVRATVLEPVRPSDFPDALVPRLARVQGLIAGARCGMTTRSSASRSRSRAGSDCSRTVRADSITTVLADLGRPVVGLVEAERELANAREDLAGIRLRAAERGRSSAVVS
jgi:hypothetical protein